MKDPGTATHRYLRWAIGALTLLIAVAIWEAAVDMGGVSERVLAAPSAVVRSIVASWGVLGPATGLTVVEGGSGFLVSIAAGLLIGVLLYLSRIFSAAFYPLLAMAQTLPLITVAPLFVIWFGFEPVGKIVMVAIFSTFPIAVQTYRGLCAVPAFYSDVALTCGASQTWTLFHVKLRVAAHHIFGGLKIAAAYVFATAATAEYLGARNGLGIVLQSAFNSFRTPLIFAATLIIVAATGVLLLLLNLTERLAFGTTAAQFAAGDDL
ncbi:MAG: ABC transporter permease subunit [Bifidobacteriaceae bacterium]|jgi:ABC-type nitrate/sulfonate/bicarbonate transport system permease component|nr:ABC transporter permease subunit [Bifidobacteriaceae bacterium]MCI1915509.1 ABC transporter permease subunit [Bifidobacteriaceae bacterium]